MKTFFAKPHFDTLMGKRGREGGMILPGRKNGVLIVAYIK